MYLDMATIKQLNSESELDQALTDSKKLMVLYFCAEWSDECKSIAPVIAEYGKDFVYSNMVIYEIDVEKFEKLAQKYEKVEIVPTFVFFKSGKNIDQVSGYNPPDLNKKIKHWLQTNVIPQAGGTNGSSAVGQKSLEERLRSLLNSHTVMLFMKGSPQEPKCGFSRQIIGILNECKAKYGHFDILSDEEIRQGLKTYSNWPTYPQLYVKGELLGGLDIVKEMQQSGELQSMLNA